MGCEVENQMEAREREGPLARQPSRCRGPIAALPDGGTIAHRRRSSILHGLNPRK